MDFPLQFIDDCVQRYNDGFILSFEMACKKQTNKYKEKLLILQSIGIIVIKSKGKGLSPF